MSVAYCENCNRDIDLDVDVEHFEECGVDTPEEIKDFEPTWQADFEKMMNTAKRIIARQKLIDELERQR